MVGESNLGSDRLGSFFLTAGSKNDPKHEKDAKNWQAESHQVENDLKLLGECYCSVKIIAGKGA